MITEGEGMPDVTSRHDNVNRTEVNLKIGVDEHLSHLFKRLFPKDVGSDVGQKLDLILSKLEIIMSEITDLQAALDAQSQALTDFTTTLQAAISAIQTEINQLTAAVQSATDLAVLKQQVSDAATRVQSATDNISTANSTLAAQVTALSADDPTPPTP